MVVYSITNILDNKKYIGLTEKTFNRRKKQHIAMLKRNDHKNKHLQNSWNKYGESNFLFEVLEQCNFRNEIDFLERYYIKFYNSCDMQFGYNKTNGGDIPTMTQETKNKISLSKKGKYSGINNPFYGKTHSDEFKLKHSQTVWSKGLFGRFNATSKKVLGLSPDQIEICFFSLIDAHIFTNCSKGNICSVAQGKWEKTKGWSFSYL